MKNVLFGIVLAFIALFSIAIDANMPKEKVVYPHETTFHKVEAMTPNANINIGSAVKENLPKYNDVNSFVEYLNATFNYDFEIIHKLENYHDDYLNMDVDETAYIACKNGIGDELIVFTVTYLDNNLIDITITANIFKDDDFGNYEKQLHTILAYETNNNFANEYFVFDKYSENTYSNKEYVFFNETHCGSGVIFEGGKDFSFDGVSYFFTATKCL